MTPIIERRAAVDCSHLSFITQPLLQRVYGARGISDAKDLEYQLKNLLNPATLKGSDKAAVLLLDAIKQQKRITIVGDFAFSDEKNACFSCYRYRRTSWRFMGHFISHKIRTT